MIFYGVPNFRLGKHQVNHVIKAHSGIQPAHRLQNKPQTLLHCKSEQLHMQRHLTENFQLHEVLKPVHTLKINTYQCDSKIANHRGTWATLVYSQAAICLPRNKL